MGAEFGVIVLWSPGDLQDSLERRSKYLACEGPVRANSTGKTKLTNAEILSGMIPKFHQYIFPLILWMET